MGPMGRTAPKMTSRTRNNSTDSAIRGTRRAPARTAQRDGLSLMEMMLVLAILVGVAALVAPALHGPLDDHRLLRSADLIRAQWTRARVAAMKNGQMYVFRCIPASDEYVVEPWSADVDAAEASQQALSSNVAPALPRASGDKPRALGIRGQRLPDGIQFVTGETRLDARASEALSTATTASAPDASLPPIVFYPDGSASDARVILTNERFFVEVAVRGLTGMVRVSELLNAEELTQRGGVNP